MVEFQKRSNLSDIVTLNINLSRAHEIQYYMNALGFTPKSGSYYPTSGDSACEDARYYFTAEGQLVDSKYIGDPNPVP